MRATTASDTEQQGQAERYRALIVPHVRSLYPSAFALTRSAPDAEDLVQDTLVRAYTQLHQLRVDDDTLPGGGSPPAWLRAIMRNLFLSGYRKKRREPSFVSLDTLGGLGLAVAAARDGAVRGDAVSPELLVLFRMERAAFVHALGALPPAYKAVMWLAVVDGLSYQEIAGRLQVPVGTVRSRLSRGRQRVQRALYAWQQHAPDS